MTAIRGVINALLKPATTPPNAAPITTPTAISTTFPRRMNFLKPSNILCPLAKLECGQCKSEGAAGQAPPCGSVGREPRFASRTWVGRFGQCVRLDGESSDPHRHHDIPVLII